MTRIETHKATRAKRKSFVPKRSLFLSPEQLKSILNERSSLRGINLHSEKNLPLKPEILEYTDFLPESADWSERVYTIKNGITSRPKCICGSDVNFAQNNVGYHQFCSRKCSAESNSTKTRRAQTNINNYGDPVAFRNPEIKEKQKATVLSRYGVTNSWGLRKAPGSYSKISQELFWNVWHNSNQCGEQFFAELNEELRIKINGQLFKPDYAQVDGGDLRIIEFDGDYWHSSSQGRDLDRQCILEANDWKILRVKEHEYNSDKQETIDRCIAFLNGELD